MIGERQTARVRRGAILTAAAALVLLGVLSLVYRDLLLNWQPAPRGATWRMPLALLSGAILMLSGIGLATAWRRTAAALAALWIGLWALGLHMPVVVATNGNVAALLGVAEMVAMAAGLATLVVPGSRLRWLTVAFGLACLVFGVSHFVYADFTARMVPPWLPNRLEIAHATGAIHTAVGLALLAGWRVRSAALVEAAMMAGFVVLLHLPDVLLAPTDRAKWTILGIATLLTAAAALIATAPRNARQSRCNGSKLSYRASGGAPATVRPCRSRNAWRTISACCSIP